ncbi:MAG: GxxExxY protein [Candidatus Atribacteria bacterium]|nr:GxxExxY protein [Candidatus Atribacteria bacterium]
MHTNNKEEYPFKKECYDIIGCAMEVHNELGSGFLEAVYQKALGIVFEEKAIPFVKETILEINFKGIVLNKKYIADFLCYNEIIVELKAKDGLGEHDIAQVLNYLKATGKKLGLLINFGTTKLQYKRVIL